MTEQVLFGIMPYLKTSEPVAVRGIHFWPSQDLDKHSQIADDCKARLQTLFRMFFLQNDIRVREMLYTHLHLDSDDERTSQLLRHLWEARVLIGYLYSSPHFPGGDPFLLYEHADLYLLRSAMVSKFLIWGEDGESDNSADSLTLRDSMVEGYEGSLNRRSLVWVADGCRLYPSLPNFWLNDSQDLSRDLELLELYDYGWPLLHLIRAREVEDDDSEARIFTALEWYNRSTSGHIGEDARLVYLAIAFESLFELEQGPAIKDRLRDFALSLLGTVPRLDSWVEQFYEARSKIVHKGSWQHLAFYATDSGSYKDILKGKQEGVEYRRLITYGRRVFRLCLNTILAGTLMAAQSGLRSLFFHNQERLNSICEQLNRVDLLPAKKLLQVSRDVRDLHEYWLESQDLTELKTVIGTGRLLLKVYLETKPQLPDKVMRQIENVVQPSEDASEYEQLELFRGLANCIKRWTGSEIGVGSAPPRDPLDVVRLYVQYAAKPGFLLRSRWGSG